MQISGKDLQLVLDSLRELESDVNNTIVTCPEPELFQQDLLELDQRLESVKKLQARIINSINRASIKGPL